MGVVQLSDPSGQYEAVMFEESLTQYRDLLEKGADVMRHAQRARRGRGRARAIVHVEKLAEAAARSHKGLKVFLRDEAPLPSIAAAAARARRRRDFAGRDARARRRAKSK